MTIKMRMKKPRKGKKMTRRQKALFGEKGDKVVVLTLSEFKRLVEPKKTTRRRRYRGGLVDMTTGKRLKYTPED